MNNKEAWLVWLKAAAIRAIKTWGQAAVAYIGSSAVGLFELDWYTFFSITLMAAFCSIVTSLAGLPEATSPIRDAKDDKQTITATKDPNSGYIIRKTDNSLKDCDISNPEWQVNQALEIDPSNGLPIGWEAPNGDAK